MPAATCCPRPPRRPRHAAAAATPSPRRRRSTPETCSTQRGYTAGQYGCLDDALDARVRLADQRQSNATSGAYGIPQALPGTKMADYGSDWRTNPQLQVRWGIDYIAQRYGSAMCRRQPQPLRYGWY